MPRRMINLNLKNKVILLASVLIFLIVCCLITGILGLYRIDINRNRAKVAVKIYDEFNLLIILFEKNLMGPHDYLIHGGKDEERIFIEDYKKLIDKKDRIKRLIISQKARHGLKFEEVLSKAESQLFFIENQLPELRTKVMNIFSLEFPPEVNTAGFYMEEMDSFVAKLETNLEKESILLLEYAEKIKAKIDKVNRQTLFFLIILGIIAVLCGIILSWYLIRSITKPLDHLINASRKIKEGDLTERVKIETKDEIAELAFSFNEMVCDLAETQDFISIILEGSGDAMCVIDKDFNILKINSQMSKILNLPAKKVVGGKCYEYLRCEICDTKNCILKRALNGEEWIDVETEKETTEKGNIPVELVATPFKRKGEVIGVIESFRDITERYRAEERFRLAAKVSSDFIYEWDMRNDSLEWFGGFEEAMGYKPGEIPFTIEAWVKMIHPDDQKKFKDSVERHRKTTDIICEEYRIQRKDGSWLYWSDRGMPVLDEKGMPVKWIGGCTDITDRKKAEEKVRESKEKYESLILSIPDAVYSALPDEMGMRTFMSDRWEDWTGYSPQDFYKDPKLWSKSILPEDRDKAVEAYIEACKKGNDYICEYRVLHKDTGKIRYLRDHAIAIKDHEGKILRLDGIVSDITKQKWGQNALQENEKRFRDIAYNLGDLIWEIDKNGVFTYCSETINDILGYSPDEVIGKTPFDLMPQDEAKRLGEIFSKAAQNMKPIKDLENWSVHKNGKLVCILTNGVPVLDERGKLKGYRGAGKDITEKHRMEKELLKMQKLESIGVLAGGIAHDYNNILTAILGNISLGKVYAKPGDDIYEILEEAEKASLRAKEVTSRLITFSKGGAPVKKKQSIAALIKDSANSALEGSNIKCGIFIPDDLWQVEIDGKQIAQVIRNTVINAGQAIPKEGTIKISASNITIDSKRGLPIMEGNYVKIRIEDQGIGMADEVRSRIFDPFFSTKQLGSGLGLSVSYSIIKQHNGHIRVESKPGFGTTFYIYLPAYKKEILPAYKKEIPKSEHLEKTVSKGKGKILLLDDEEMVRNIAGKMLNHLDYECEFAEDGEKAIELYKMAKETGEPFDALILDLTIPGGIGGREAIKRLIEIDPEVNAIVSSGYSNDPVMTSFCEYGFNGAVLKPYDMKELSETLHKVITEKAAVKV